MLLAVLLVTMASLNTLTATELAQRLDAGTATAEAIVRDHLDRIDQRDADVLAWSYLAREGALQNRQDARSRTTAGPSSRHPMGVKDIIDSFDQPTTYGSPIYRTHQPLADAATVALARDAGHPARQDGDTEFANRHPGPTRNPHNAAHTPGGSSSGSAAARRGFPERTRNRYADRRFRDPGPAAFCGNRWLQAELRPLCAGRHEGQHGVARHDRRLCAQRRRHCLFRAALMAIPYLPVAKVERPPRIAVALTHHRGRTLA